MKSNSMKLKCIAAICMAIGTTSAFAVTVAPLASAAFDAAAPQNFVNTNIPDAKLYIAGSSALGGAVSPVVAADIFVVGQFIKINDNGSPSGNLPVAGVNTGPKGVTAWFGIGASTLPAAYAGKKIYVVYNNNNGSAAGVSQLLSAPTLKAYVPEADVVSIGPINTKTLALATTLVGASAGSCTLNSASTTAAPVVDCTTHGLMQADMAISDVNVTELYALETASAGTAPSTKTLDANLTVPLTKTLTVSQLAVQGFGIAVNSTLYAALQTQNIADGLLPSTCAGNADGVIAGVPTDAQAACQPSVRKADYSSLVSGKVPSAAALIPGDTTALVLARRDNFSGTQASSNIFFADNACGNNVVGGKTLAGDLGGALSILSSTSTVPAGLTVLAAATGGAVKTALNSTTGYAIGVMGLNTTQSSTDTWKFVKIDGVSPIFSAAGVYDANQRVAFANGSYQFAETSFAVTPVKAAAKATGTGLVATIISGLTNSAQHNLTGIGYTDGVVAGQQTHYAHAGTPTNNCSPVVHL